MINKRAKKWEKVDKSLKSLSLSLSISFSKNIYFHWQKIFHQSRQIQIFFFKLTPSIPERILKRNKEVFQSKIIKLEKKENVKYQYKKINFSENQTFTNIW